MRRSREEAEFYDSKIHFETNWAITRKIYKDNIIQGYLEMAGHLIGSMYLAIELLYIFLFSPLSYETEMAITVLNYIGVGIVFAEMLKIRE